MAEMTVIKITSGGCGVKVINENGTELNVLKTPKDGPFECDIEQAKRLVNLGVAELVSPWTVPEDEDERPGQTSGHLDAEQLESMNYNDLKKLAADMGVKAESNKKADLIAAIVAAEVEAGEETEDEDEDGETEDEDGLPNLTPADPE